MAGVRLVATVRADFLTRVAALPRLGDEVSRALYLLRPLTAEKTREVVVGPAESTNVRFESEELIRELVESTANTDGGLPLLQFALALLWEGRDRERGMITAAELATMGGVGGALARHGDAVVEGLTPSQRAAVRKVMVRLVTLENTRARRTGSELTGGDPVMQEALDALVRGRLLVAYEATDGSAYELGHEVLIHGWGTLGLWLQEDAGWRAARERLAQASMEWERLQRGREALWAARQLTELAGVEWSGLSPREEAFLNASRRSVLRRKRTRWALVAAIPIGLALLYGGIELRARRQLDRQVDQRVDEARTAFAATESQRAELDRLRRQAYELFDGRDNAGGEANWTRVLALGRTEDRELSHAAQSLEGALALDPRRRDVRALLGDVLLQRALLAESERRQSQLDELLQRLALYDPNGTRRRAWSAPAKLSVETTPTAATIRIERYEEDDRQRLVAGTAQLLGTSPIESSDREPGSYRLLIHAAGRAPVALPILLRRGESLQVHADLPVVGLVPAGFIYVPAGRFVYGSTADEDLRRSFFDAVPAHDRTTGSFLIARNELTYSEWIEFLRSLSPSERARRLPIAGASAGGSGSLRLEEIDGGFRLSFQPGAKLHSARTGELLRYPTRARRAEQDWLRFPVTAISAEDAQAYVEWLNASGKLHGARLCTELEWERAGRGADDREFPHGRRLEPDDIDFDQTYNRDPIGMGPDEIGSHPVSRSPFGLDDTSGNAMEWTTGLNPGEFVIRGGSFYHDTKTAQLTNRSVSVPTLRDATTGVRICATPASSSQTR